MKQISKSQWERYKQTDGREVIERFERLLRLEMSPEEILELVQKINPSFFQNYTEKEKKAVLNAISYCLDEVIASAETAGDNIVEVYNELMRRLGQPEVSHPNKTIDELEEKDFKFALQIMMSLSIALSVRYSGFFIPYFWTKQFYFLEKIADKYDIQLPAVPKKSEYFQRCVYYFLFCDGMAEFAEMNQLSRAELCAFLYDYELNLLREELAQESASDELPTALQGWFLVGNRSDGEKEMTSGFWQASPETLRGDIMVFYEKSPVKAINAIWRAATNGSNDPLFYYYSSTNICDKIDIPPITFDELKADPYFMNHSLVRKQFQGGSGWPITSVDYDNLLRMLEAKGFDITKLPRLMAHKTPEGTIVENEADVHAKLVMPLLADMGWTIENGEVLEQVNHHVGRGETQKMGRTDISLHPYGSDMKLATVIIEEKFWMRNEAEIAAAFKQCLSYANLSNSQVLVTCDKHQIRLYIRKKDGLFDTTAPIIFYWDELSNPDKYKELQKLLSSKP